MSNQQKNIDNALIYSSITNYINEKTYPAYGYLLDNLAPNGSSKLKNEDLNNILEKTIIKKACCRQNTNRDNEQYYETDVVLPATSGTQGTTLTQTVLVNKSYCDPLYTGSNTTGCSNFSKLYCENSKLLYDTSISKGTVDAPWIMMVPWCANHKSLVEEKAEFDAEMRQQKNREASREQTKKLIKEVIGDTSDNQEYLNDKSNKPTGNTGGNNSSNPNKSKTIYYVITGFVIFLILISIIIFIIMYK